MTLTAYSNKNVKWDLTLNGTTPSELTLVDIAIEYPGTEDPIEDVMYLPKFTFTFLGTKELYDDFGEITNTSHPFELASDSGYKWLGYLTPDVFSMPNTGYREEFSMNGISQVEALKFLKFPFEEYDDYLINVVKTVEDIIKDNTGIASISQHFTYNHNQLAGMHVMPLCFSMNDDDNAYISLYETLEWACSSLGLRLVLNWDNTVGIWDLIDVFSEGSADYSKLKHAGIDETFETGKVFESVIVQCKEARIEIKNIDLKLPEDRSRSEHTIQIRQGAERWKGPLGITITGKNSTAHTHNRYVGYFKEKQFDGWKFPKYDVITGQEIEEWWNPEKIFTEDDIPSPGAYPIIYRKDSESWEKAMMIVSTYDHPTAGITVNLEGVPYAVYKQNMVPNTGDYLCFNGTVIGSPHINRDPNKWPTLARGGVYRTPWVLVKADEGEIWTQCPCPVPVGKGDGDQADVETLTDFVHTTWLLASVCFAGKYWKPDSWGGGEWVDVETKFEIRNESKNVKKDKGINLFQQPWEISTKVDASGEIDKYFEKVTGYWLKLPNKYGELVVTLYTPEVSRRFTGIVGVVTFLTNIQISKINIYNNTDFFEKNNMTYHAGKDENIIGVESNKYDVYLSSYKENMFESYLSTLYSDKEGEDRVVNLSWNYGEGSRIEERPEYRIARIALYYISGMKSISDVLNINDRLFVYKYNENLLWENGCTINPLMDTVNVKYSYNTLNYGS
ncbi:MAG: hypothetical protein LBB73_07540 [Dysgonamonadaceae bacterium]|jgi:hypothetical protein|nr:hypothetical protein [Dysgonamonadaceae bacterium]